MFSAHPISSHPSHKQQPWSAVVFFVLLAGLTLSIYAQGWGGSWHFDDRHNLGALEQVFAQGRIHTNTALEFIFSGNAGPLGRPLALASFLVDGSAWPNYPRGVLYTNSLLHVMNGFLLWAVLFNLGRSHNWPQGKATWLASIGAGLWLLLPLSVSGVLMAVQRMAILSSSFMLLGLWLYLLARQRLGKPGWKAWLGMAIGLGLGTLLGAFTKEQAGILPLLVWVLEGCWLPRPTFRDQSQQRHWRIFKAVFFFIPTIIIFGYLLRIIFHAESAYSPREFDLPQRLWSQAVILWDYLRLAFLPRAVAFGPFHDDYTIYDNNHILAWVALGAWLAAALLAFLLRNTTRLPLFALLWFTTAHLVESSIIPLELYFEHRNYLALVGPVFALVVAAWEYTERKITNNNGKRYWRIFFLGVSAYIFMFTLILWQTTSLFGQPAVAAQMWYEQHPRSIRAVQYFAHHKVLQEKVPEALQALDTTAQLRPYAGTLKLQGLQLACVLNRPESELQQRLDIILHELPLAQQRFSVIPTLEKLKTLNKKDGCSGFIKKEHLLSIAQAALANPRISSAPQGRANLHVFMAMIFAEERDLDSTMKHLLAALDAEPNLRHLQLTTAILKSAGLKKEAEDILKNYPMRYPKNPWMKNRLEAEWENLYKQVHE